RPLAPQPTGILHPTLAAPRRLAPSRRPPEFATDTPAGQVSSRANQPVLHTASLRALLPPSRQSPPAAARTKLPLRPAIERATVREPPVTARSLSLRRLPQPS